MSTHAAVERSQNLLKYAYGITLVLIGLDKVFQTNRLVDWKLYVSPLAQSIIPLSPTTIVLVLGIAEILLGIALLTAWTREAAYVMIAVLGLIILNLISLHLYDIAARDLLIALGALTLAWMSDAREITYGE
jgi:uncharacterized membrane protein